MRGQAKCITDQPVLGQPVIPLWNSQSPRRLDRLLPDRYRGNAAIKS